MKSNDTKSNEQSSEKSTKKKIIDEEISLNNEMKAVPLSEDETINPSGSSVEQKPVEYNTNAQSATEQAETDKLQYSTCDVEDEDDDVPGDFFDDFLKDDFMAALDVIDDDDDDVENDGVFTNRNVNLSHNDTEVSTLKMQDDEKKERIVNTKYKESERKGRSKKSNPHRRNSNDIGIHRDPKKTRRDIELDKARCEKNKEMKRISEKLKLVETGMVPPGMEMETDIELIQKQRVLEKSDIDLPKGLSSKKKSNSLKSGFTKESLRYRSKSPKRSHRTMSNSRSPLGTSKRLIHRLRSHLIHNPTRDRNKSPLNIHDRHASPLKSRNRRDSPRKSRDHRGSPLRSQDRRRSPRELRARRHSPMSSRDRHESPKRLHRLDSPLRSRDRRESSKERRISRNHDGKRSQERSRSRSHDRRPRTSRSSKRKREQKSFLQEIAEKLRNPRPFESQPTPAYIHPTGTQVASSLSVPTPVPAPLLSTQYPLQTQSYNRGFFIGTPQANILPTQSAHYQVGLLEQIQNPLHQQTVHQPDYGTSMPFNFSHSQIHNNLGLHAMVQLKSEFKANDNLNKFCESKKITLADFLSITANPEVYLPGSEQMKHKNDVIIRCQQAITYLENNKKRFTGPLILRKDDNISNSQQEKFKSPLLKSWDLKLPFTEIPNTTEHKIKLSAYIDTLLRNQGLLNEVIVIDDELELNSEFSESSSVPPSAPIISLDNDNTRKSARDGENISEQTDTTRCLVCEKRSKIVTKSIGVQCGNNLKFSIGTQVREEAFAPTIPKIQSLASLTPAQLLAGSVVGPSKIHDVDDYNKNFRKKSRPFDYANHTISPQQAPPPPRNIFNRPTGSDTINKYNYY
ncbi:uncharacterized protein LOC130451156 [Diorhabda sublineata]|uniref:uncharacterized protein LOC130451156 n=1 Tax=Diorhabda sublineata TaxID=1163346 RepID=UPI0024E0BF8E|nr:uncharacterized protein LOC130451156 [Diorhabda sublineata]